MKRIMGLIGIGLLAALVLLWSGVSGGTGISRGKNINSPKAPLKAAPANPQFVKYRKLKAAGALEAGANGKGGGYIPPVMDMSHLKRIKVARPQALQGVPLPPSWDWRENKGVTPVRDQGGCGSCWAFACMGALESLYKHSLNNYPNINLSENNMISCHWPWLWGRCEGGNSYIASGYLVGLIQKPPDSFKYRHKGALLDSSDPYKATSHNDRLCENRPNPKLNVESFKWVGGAGDELKYAIYNTGPVTTALDWDSAYYDASTYIYYYPTPPADAFNHMVLLVGWDDNLPFPGGQGCWIAKNSWGKSFGDEGYFYIPYGSGNVGNGGDNLYFDSWRKYSKYELAYMEDLPGMINAVGPFDAPLDTMTGGVIFSPTYDFEELTHVEFYTTSPNAQFEIRVWGQAVVEDWDAGEPVSFYNLMTYQTGVCQEMGYYSIELNAPQVLVWEPNRFYGIQVKFTTPQYDYPLPVAYPVTDMIGDFFDADEVSARSYYYDPATGKFWYLWVDDPVNPGIVPSAICIRARTYH